MTVVLRPTEPRYWAMLKFVLRSVGYFEDSGRKFGGFWVIVMGILLVYVNHPDAVRSLAL